MNTYLIRKPWMTLGDDFVINSTDDDGEGMAFQVTQKILRLRQTYFMEDADGNEIYKIMERNVPNHRVCIYAEDDRVAVVRKRGDGSYWAHVDDERDLFINGDIESGGVLVSNIGGLNVARLTEAWLFSITDMYQCDIRADQDDALIMAVITAVQYLAGDDGDDDDDDPDMIGPLGAVLFSNAFLMRKAWLTIGDDFVINGIGGEDLAFQVTEKVLRIRQMYHLENADGELVHVIRERMRPNHRVVIEDGEGGRVAVVRKRGDGSYWTHVDDDRDIFVTGEASEGVMELSNIGGLNVGQLRPASMMESIFPNAPDMHAVRVRADQDEALILATMIAVMYLHEDEGDDDEDGEEEEEEEEGGDDDEGGGGRRFRRRFG